MTDDDLDLSLWTVSLPGTRSIRARELPIEGAWERAVLSARVSEIWSEGLIASEAGTRLHTSMSGTISRLLDECLPYESGLSPQSITAWEARNAAHVDGEDRITAAANFLGVRSLGRAAAIIGYDWLAS